MAGGRPHELLQSSVQRLVGQFLISCGFGDPKINHLRNRNAIVERHQNVRRLEIAMNDALLVSVLDRLANLDEELEPGGGGEVMLVAVIGDSYALHQLHHEEMGARCRSSPHPGLWAILG